MSKRYAIFKLEARKIFENSNKSFAFNILDDSVKLTLATEETFPTVRTAEDAMDQLELNQIYLIQEVYFHTYKNTTMN